MAERVISYESIAPLRRDVERLQRSVNGLDDKVDNIGSKIEEVKAEVEAISKKFNEFMEDRVRAEALAQATTELVRVRQEIEREFGNYNLVRETMLGVLQATDLALVKKATMSRVSEELMLSTPKYWLAPCLIAITAWINNDRDLADRAIKEALRRDEERTSLTMALICRRNGRKETCYEWLARYFSTLNANNFTEGGYTFIDAYINKVFGEDEKHICSDYMANWLSQIKSGEENFEEKQIETWKSYYASSTPANIADYPHLKENVKEFGNIESYVSRINYSKSLMERFDKINKSEVNIEKIRERVDRHLVEVISNYATEEVYIRDEEYCFQKVKESNGNRKYTEIKKELKARRVEERQKKIDLVETMTNSIIRENNISISGKKTAIAMLKPYMNKGFDRYLEENRSKFPESISLNINGYEMNVDKTCDTDNMDLAYKEYLDNKEKQEKENLKISVEKGQKACKIGTVVLAIFGILGILANPMVGIVVMAIAVFVFVQGNNKKTYARGLEKIEAKYKKLATEGSRKISTCISEWNNLNTSVDEFNTNKRDLIA